MEFSRIAPVLPVRDVDAALTHYRALGFSAEAYSEAGSVGPVYGFLARGKVELHLTRVDGLEAENNTSACYIYVDDADALYDEWKVAAVSGKLTAPVDTPYCLREFAHIDGDGNLLRIGSPLPTPT